MPSKHHTDEVFSERRPRNQLNLKYNLNEEQKKQKLKYLQLQ